MDRQSSGQLSPPQRKLSHLAVQLCLIVSVLVIFAQVASFEFTDYDDGLYVYHNAYVRSGLNLESIRWAFTAVVASNWMPVTLLSHIVAYQFFGLHSGMHHLVNVVFHLLAALLLFAAIRRATGASGPSAFVAFVFALHPMHVESVAWISERKDVFGAFFFFLALYYYVLYTERPGLVRYLAFAAPFCFGLMSKPTVVTFPFMLLLLDEWPLSRKREAKLLWEKLPLFALSAVCCVMTFWTQHDAGSVLAVPFGTRVENAFVSCVTYIGQMFWPVRLAVFYPLSQRISPWDATLAVLLVLGVTVLVIVGWQKRPYLAVGWFWYLGSLIPVIGLVQVGLQAHADRYSYIPMTGLSIMLAWGAADVAREWPWARTAVAWAALAVCVAYVPLAWKQTTYWRNTETLFQHAIDVTPNNWGAEYYLGNYLMKTAGRRGEAVDHFEAALRINPDLAVAHNNIGLCMVEADLYSAAIPHFEKALRIQPDFGEAGNNLGWCLNKAGRYADAIPYLQAAVRVEPNQAGFRFNLASAFEKLPDHQPEAITEYQAALRLRPDYVEAAHNLGMLLASVGRTDEAIVQLEAAERVRPDTERSETIERLRSGRM